MLNIFADDVLRVHLVEGQGALRGGSGSPLTTAAAVNEIERLTRQHAAGHLDAAEYATLKSQVLERLGAARSIGRPSLAGPLQGGQAPSDPLADPRRVRSQAVEAEANDRVGWKTASPLSGAETKKRTSGVRQKLAGS